MIDSVLWPKVNAAISKKFKVLAHVDLPCADYQPEYLDNILKEFKNRVFKKNEIILITHYDTQYYLPSCKFGITLFNLHETLSTYNIPTEFVIMFTNHYGIEEELALLANIFYFSNKIKSFASFYDVIGTIDTINDIDINHNNIDHLFCCINGQQRSNRLFFLSMLKHYNLLELGLVTTNFQKERCIDPIISKIETNQSIINYIKLNVVTRIADKLTFDKRSRLIFEKYYNEFKDKNLSNDIVHGQPNDKQTRWQPNFIQRSLFYLVTETVGDYPYPFLTEKTFKGILCKRPMLIAGAQHSLAMLRDLGFKTWNNFWNEDYDDDEYFYQRADKIAKILSKYKSVPVDELKSICIDMESILEYNFQYYKSNFCKRDLDIFLQSIESSKA
jgi:hypothetical protein